MIRQWVAVFGLLLCSLPSAAEALSVVRLPDLLKTSLHEAAERCDAGRERAELASLSPEERSRRINKLDRDGYSPLAYAAQEGCIEIVRLLLESGAAVDAGKEQGGWTPLLDAAEQRHAEVVRYLLAHGADPNVRTRIGKAPLVEAILGPFLQHGPEGDRDGTVRTLLEHSADVNLRGEYGRTPLMAAVLTRDAKLTRLLIDAGADVNARDDKDGTAWVLAMERGESEIARVLRAAGAAERYDALEWSGEYGKYRHEVSRVVTNTADWDAIWESLFHSKAPPVDFARYAVACIFLGERPTGGYGIDFEKPNAQGDTLVISYRERRSTGFVTQAITYPYKLKVFRIPSGLKAVLRQGRE